MEHPGVTIQDTEEVILSSPEIGQDYHLFIQRPRSYSRSENTYPVLYLLDGDQFFGMTTDIARLLHHRDGVPELLIVGIGYGSHVSDHFNERMRDLSPSAVAQYPSSGGAEAFLQFIREKVIPYVEETYRTRSGDRTLVGISIGGLFALYTLFQHPKVFKRYLISSPSVQWDNGLVFEYEEQAVGQGIELSGKVFLSAGEQRTKRI